MPDIQLTLPLGVHTLAQLEACRLAIEAQADNLADEQSASSLADFDTETQRWLASLIEQLGAEAAVTKLTDFARSAMVFELELARSPGDELMAAIVQWLRSSLDQNLMIRVHVQRSLIGGFRLRTGKHAYDLSLATALRAHTQQATELLHG